MPPPTLFSFLLFPSAIPLFLLKLSPWRLVSHCAWQPSLCVCVWGGGGGGSGGGGGGGVRVWYVCDCACNWEESVFVWLLPSAPLCVLRHRGARLQRSYAPPSLSLFLSLPVPLSLCVFHGTIEQWEWLVLPRSSPGVCVCVCVCVSVCALNRNWEKKRETEMGCSAGRKAELRREQEKQELG